jgi:hypothetical protein
MATVKFPLFSLEATGKIGLHFYIQKRSGGRFCFAMYKVEEVKQTRLQMFYRRVFGVLSENWRIETPAACAQYNRDASRLKMSGFALYYKLFFESISSARTGTAICGFSRAGVVP